MKLKIFLIFFVFILLLVAVYLLGRKLSDSGENMTIIRKPPSKSDILNLIDDDFGRQFFSKLKLEYAKDLGAQDSAIESKWCGAAKDSAYNLFERGLFDRVSSDNFISMPSPISERFDIYGVRSLGYRDLGVAFKEGSECINLYVIDNQ
ncbi:hypothetical protein [Allorhizobium terrae]|uniref:Uncharacterized protein n=1 Tax=Allorhizobium terrae TaxID=1848972 RepID=A0A4S3ZPY8_9HYPH|nr:hypothetical protein [Allorhizobium terrae]THF47590.1 hypothetical protein E6C51_17910 [Allorhizobium terrae]